MGGIISRYAGALAFASTNMPAFLAVLPVMVGLDFLAVTGICWENNLRDDVANAARQRILKDLTKLDEFAELISEVEPALRDALGRAMAEITKLEKSGRFDRSTFQRQQEAIIGMIEKDVWQALEPKITDLRKKKRIKAWIENMKTKLQGVDEIQQRAADILRENVREILYDFNSKCEEHLGQSIPGEIEGDSADKAMHELAETIVEKIIDCNLDFDTALGQVVAEIKSSGILETQGKEKLISDLLRGSRNNDGDIGLEKLFADFRRDFLDPGDGTLHLPKQTEIKTLDQTKISRNADRRDKKGGKTDAESN